MANFGFDICPGNVFFIGLSIGYEFLIRGIDSLNRRTSDSLLLCSVFLSGVSSGKSEPYFMTSRRKLLLDIDTIALVRGGKSDQESNSVNRFCLQ